MEMLPEPYFRTFPFLGNNLGYVAKMESENEERLLNGEIHEWVVDKSIPGQVVSAHRRMSVQETKYKICIFTIPKQQQARRKMRGNFVCFQGCPYYRRHRAKYVTLSI